MPFHHAALLIVCLTYYIFFCWCFVLRHNSTIFLLKKKSGTKTSVSIAEVGLNNSVFWLTSSSPKPPFETSMPTHPTSTLEILLLSLKKDSPLVYTNYYYYYFWLPHGIFKFNSPVLLLISVFLIHTKN